MDSGLKLFVSDDPTKGVGSFRQQDRSGHFGTGIVGTIGYVVLPTGVSTDVSRDIV